MAELVCITCPLGCRLNVETVPATAASAAAGTAASAASAAESLIVTGNRCARGLAYAREEFLSPRRTVTTTCRITHAPAAGPADAAAAESAPRRMPVRTSAAFPKERVPELLEYLRGFEAALPVRRGQVLAGNLLGTGIDLVAARDMPSTWADR